MKLTREAIQRMISQKQGTSNVTVINQEGGGGGGGVTLGPLLTSLNAEAMPSAEGYLHWTGSAWAFDTPTGGDPVDLTPYALKTWVQTNYASKDDIADFITKDEADTYYAALSHTHANYLPLSAGSSKPLTGSLYITGNSGITWVGGVGMLACTPESGWTGISSSQWGVGALSAQGVIRSNANDILHYRNGTNYKIWDAYNFTPSDYLPLTGGTVESLTVTNGLDADSMTVGSIVNSDTLAEYLDADAMQTWGDGRYLKLTDKAGLFTQLANYDGALQITIGGTQKSVTIAYASTAGSASTAVNADKLDNHHASDFALASSLGNYLPLTGGTLDGSLYMKSVLSTDNYPARTGQAIGMFAQLNQHATQGDDGNRGGLFFMYGRESGVAQDKLNSIIINCLSEYKSDWYSGDYGLMITSDDIKFKGTSLAKVTDLSSYLPLTGGTVNGNLNVKGTIQAQDSNGNNKVIIYGLTGNIRAEKVYIGGSTSGYEAATHDWVTGQGYQANVIETVKVAGTALTPTNKAVDIPAATSDGSTFGVVAIGTGFSFDEDRLCVDTSTFATRAWADGRYLPLTAGTDKPLTGILWMDNNLVMANPNHTINDDSTKIAFYTNKNYPNISPYIQAINENNYGRKRLSVFQKNVADLDTPQVEVFTIKPDGNVGIGTITPAHKLDVNGDAAIGTNLSVGGNADIVGDLNVVVELNVGDVTNGGLWLSDSELGVWSMSGTARQDTTLMSLASGGVTFSGDTIMTGKLAVGTTTFDGSNAKLQVGGNMFATGSITSKSNAGNVSLGNGNISATNLYISTVVFGTSNNDPAIYIGNGHVYARNSQGQTTMII